MEGDSPSNQDLKLSTSQTCVRARSSSCNRLPDMKRRKLSDVSYNDIEQDKIMGIKIQYESVVTVLTEVNKAFKELKESCNKNKKNYDKAIETLTTAVAIKDKELQEAKRECADTRQKLELLQQQQIEKSNSLCIPKKLNDTYTKDSSHDVTYSAGKDSKIKEMITPNVTKRLQRKSLNQTESKDSMLDATVDDMDWKEIANIEKEMLDCYALISGISLIYDTKSSTIQNEKENGHADFECKVECGCPLDGFQFRLALDYESVKFHYQPITDSVSKEKEELIPPFMKDQISFNPAEAPKLLNRILSKLPESFHTNTVG